MVRLVYILAASHSGSTLLSMLLNAHPKVVTAGELKAENLGDPELYRCSCHALLKDCDFWHTVSEKMKARGHEFSITNARTHFGSMDSDWIRRLIKPLVRGAMEERLRDTALFLSPTWRRGKRQMLERSAALVQSVAEVASADVVVESSKIGLRLKYLLECPDLDLHVVRLVRDGRAVALTYIRPDEFADAKDARLRGGGTGTNRDTRLSMAQAAREWRRSNEEAEALIAQLQGVGVTNLSYESMCAQPLDAVNQVYAQIGLEPLQTMPNFRNVPHHIIGNGMRLDTDSAVVLDERWRSALTSEDMTVFSEVAGALNSKYGYQ